MLRHYLLQLLLILSLGHLTSCVHQDDYDTGPRQTSAQTTNDIRERAKAFFNQKHSEEKLRTSNKDNVIFGIQNLEPVWHFSKICQTPRGTRMVIPFNSEGLHTTYSSTIPSEEIHLYLNSLSFNFIIYEEFPNEEVSAYIASYQPTKEWINQNRYLKFYPENLVPINFDGEIHTYTLNYTPNMKYAYKNGVLNRTYLWKKSSNEKLRGFECTPVIEIIRKSVLSSSFDYEFNATAYEYTLISDSVFSLNCKYVIDMEIEFLRNQPNFDRDRLNRILFGGKGFEPGQSDIDNVPSYPSGGGAMFTPVPSPNGGHTNKLKVPNIKRTNFSKEAEKRLDRSLDSIYQTKSGKVILDLLIASKYQLTELKIEPKTGGDYASLGKNGTLKFHSINSITTRSVLHELIHAVQKVKNKSKQDLWGKDMGMSEFENVFIRDVVHFRAYGRDTTRGQEWAVPFYPYNEYYKTNFESYILFMKNITKQNTQWPDVKDIMKDSTFRTMSHFFGEFKKLYGHLKFNDPHYYPYASASIFEQLQKTNKSYETTVTAYMPTKYILPQAICTTR